MTITWWCQNDFNVHSYSSQAAFEGASHLGAITQYVSSCTAVGLTVQPKVLALAQERFLWQFPDLEGV